MGKAGLSEKRPLSSFLCGYFWVNTFAKLKKIYFSGWVSLRIMSSIAMTAKRAASIHLFALQSLLLVVAVSSPPVHIDDGDQR